MCLILVAWQSHPDYPLVVAANRDEFYSRPSLPAGPWSESPDIVGGRDLEAGGTWLGFRHVGSDFRFAAVTNVREPGVAKGERSRGQLPQDFLLGTQSAGNFVQAIASDAYSGFNLLCADRDALWYASNRESAPRRLTPGIYGLSNHRLDTPWPKLLTARRRFADALQHLPDTTALFELLADASIVADAELPMTGVPLPWERLLSAIFVKSPDYGTRASTVLLQRTDGHLRFSERGFGPNGTALPAAFEIVSR